VVWRGWAGWEVVVAVAAVLAAGAAVWVTLEADFLAHPGWLAVQKADFILGPVFVGLYWRRMRPESRFGPLLIGFGAVGAVYILQSATNPWLFGIAVSQHRDHGEMASISPSETLGWSRSRCPAMWCHNTVITVRWRASAHRRRSGGAGPGARRCGAKTGAPVVLVEVIAAAA
jgi:hypothetical protein